MPSFRPEPVAHLLRDLAIYAHHRELRPVYRVSETLVGPARDFIVRDGRENLAQALILRLLTPRGALASLGHPDYGSRLWELIGRLKSDELRNLCRAFVLEAVAQEPRVEAKAGRLDFDLLAERFDNFVFNLVVQPRADAAPVEIGLEVGL